MYESLNYITMVGIELAIVCMVVWLTKQIVISIKYFVKISLLVERKVNEMNTMECVENK